MGNWTVIDGGRTSGSSQVTCVGFIELRSKAVNSSDKDLGLFFIHIQVQLCQVPNPTLIKGSTTPQIINNGIHKKLMGNTWNWPNPFNLPISAIGVLSSHFSRNTSVGFPFLAYESLEV